MTQYTSAAAVQNENSIASVGHTTGLVAALLGISALGALLHARPHSTKLSGNVKLYLSVIAIEWILVLYVKLGLRPHIHFMDLLGRRWDKWSRACWDIVSAIGVALAWMAIAPLVVRLLGPENWGSFLSLLPHGKTEMSLWIAMSLTAGFSEELIFRGYLQQQASRLTGSPVLAILIQSVLFGLSHGYQGLKNMVLISVLGLLYGVLVLWRKSLLPGMLAHAVMDIVSVL
jgi:uncharacterized protein